MTLTTHDAAIVLDAQNPDKVWCVYEHQVCMKQGDPPETIMIGAARAVDIYRLVDGRTNSMWRKIFETGGTVLVRIVATTMDRDEAHRHAMDLIARQKPKCNMSGYDMRGMHRAIVCIQNNTRYNSQAEAAEKLNIPASSISRHLAGKLKHVSGFQFAYAGGLDEQPPVASQE